MDPNTREVWAYPTSGSYRESFPPGDTFLSIDGTLWIAASWFLLPCRFNEESGRLQVLRDNRNNWQTGVHAGSLARHGDWLYYTGKDWRRINLQTGKEELLVDGIDSLPKFARSGAWHIASSSHYGLVAFNKGTLYRIRIDGTAPTAGS